MTDEEIVKGVEERKLTWLSNYAIGSHKLKEEAKEKNILPDFASFDEMFWKMRFIEGAKFALNNHWHDLRKDPKDLPKECQNVLCFCHTECGYYTVGHMIKIGNDESWYINIGSKKLYNVIAWCELPKFEEN